MDIDPLPNEIHATTTITAKASESLDSFNLDLHELTVDLVTVNDEKATFSRLDDELTIDPAKPLEADTAFVAVIQYHGSPGMIFGRGAPFEMGWVHFDDGAINVWGEPDAAATWFPGNNHPRDKATYRFEITVPKPWIVAATGTLKETKPNGDKNTFIWKMDEPMATYLASINVDRYDTSAPTQSNGVTIRNYFPADFPGWQRAGFNMIPDAIDYFSGLFGPYPFPEYGVVVAEPEKFCQTTPTALEAQSLSIHCPDQFMTSEIVIVHELAHQWFGDSVSLENWKDVWLKEGFATYAEWLWETKDDPGDINELAKVRKDRFMDDPSLAVAEPEKSNLYTDESYTGGALVLQALRMKVGDEVFFKILKTYAERYRFGNAGTDEFISVAEEVSGKDLKSFFDAWLFNEVMPEFLE
jgi:aminopeptidase N